MDSSSTPLSQFLRQFQVGVQVLPSNDNRHTNTSRINNNIVIEFDNARILPNLRSRTMRSETCKKGENSRWENSCSCLHGNATRNQKKSPRRPGAARTLSPQKPQRRESIDRYQAITIKTAVAAATTSRPRIPERRSTVPSTPTNRAFLQTLTPRKPQRRDSINDLVDIVKTMQTQEDDPVTAIASSSHAPIQVPAS